MSAGGQIGLIDYGQSKQLPHEARLAFARLVRLHQRTGPSFPPFRVTVTVLHTAQWDVAPRHHGWFSSKYPAAVMSMMGNLVAECHMV